MIVMILAAASVATAVDVEPTPGGLLQSPIPMVVSTKTGKTKAGKSANAGSKTSKVKPSPTPTLMSSSNPSMNTSLSPTVTPSLTVTPSPTASATATATLIALTPPPCGNWCPTRRLLEPFGSDPEARASHSRHEYSLIKEDLSVQERLQVIDSLKGSGAKHDATFSFKYGLISKTSCSALTKNLKSSYEDDIASRDELPVGTADLMDEKYTSWLSHSPGADVYSKKLYTNDLVQMIGRDETLTILDFFEKSLGGLSIDTMYLSLHRNPGDAAVEYNVDWHVDTYATLEINLNDDYAGGHVFHLNGDGVYKTKSRVGSAIAHKDDIVHGISPKKDGARYMLILKHHFNLPEKEGVVRLSRELIGE